MRDHVVIEDWDGDGAIRLPDDVLQEMGVDVGGALYLFEEYVGTTRCLVLSKSPRIPDRIDELVGHKADFNVANALSWAKIATGVFQQNRLIADSPHPRFWITN